MAENVIPADLCDIEWSETGADADYVVIPGCKTVGIPEENPEYRDRTSLDSPGRTKEYGVGLTDVGELTLSCFYSTALYAQASAYKAASTLVYFRVKLPAMGAQVAGDTFEYRAYVNPGMPATDQDGDLMTDLKLRPSGLITWTEGATA
ncbi:phage tail protein [Pseudodonghicola flavimaris]|uniref:Major tail protein n=1 Tax=Pseudodonghicola flavimaris TaxID=3050036 RepID=A0ABT7EZ50_9RHOB|nr:hypothetical protein [Pseudodonghicola flavimaris]MDK3017625.1 hypothetical protein [Pseudodonghicola flavimaris]